MRLNGRSGICGQLGERRRDVASATIAALDRVSSSRCATVTLRRSVEINHACPISGAASPTGVVNGVMHPIDG